MQTYDLVFDKAYCTPDNVVDVISRKLTLPFVPWVGLNLLFDDQELQISEPLVWDANANVFVASISREYTDLNELKADVAWSLANGWTREPSAQ